MYEKDDQMKEQICVKEIYLANYGSYPPCPDWSKPNDWQEAFKTLPKKASETNSEIHKYFVEKEGELSDLAVASGIIASITEEVTEIARLQMQGFSGSISWQETAPEASGSLSSKIVSILLKDEYKKFFENNPTFKSGLELINDVLIPESDPDIIASKHSTYLERCISDNAQGKLVLSIPFESDYTNPVSSEKEKTQICEASVCLLLPVQKDERLFFEEINNNSLLFLTGRQHSKKVGGLKMLIGDVISGAGFEAFNAVSAEAFVFKNNQGIKEYGFYLALNTLAKKETFWKKSGELMRLEDNDLEQDFVNHLAQLYICHENAHKNFPVYGIYGEVPADIPAVIYSMKSSFDKKQTVRAIITEYVSSVVETISGGELFEGYKADLSNELFRGYLLSGVVIVNAIAESGLVTAEEGNLKLDLDKTDDFIKSLEQTDNLFHQNDEKTKEEIKLAVLNPEATKIIELFRYTKFDDEKDHAELLSTSEKVNAFTS